MASLNTDINRLNSYLIKMDTQVSQSFMRRHLTSLFVGLIFLAACASILIILFPPVGISLAAGFMTALITAGAACFGISVAAASKIGADEGRLDNYKEKRRLDITNKLANKNLQLKEKENTLRECEEQRIALQTEKQDKIDAITNSESYKSAITVIEEQFEENCKKAMGEDEVAYDLILRENSDSDLEGQLDESLSTVETQLAKGEKRVNLAASAFLEKSCDDSILSKKPQKEPQEGILSRSY